MGSGIPNSHNKMPFPISASSHDGWTYGSDA